jgi:RNA polymerase sigma-70 factor (ECF subfamily)
MDTDTRTEETLVQSVLAGSSSSFEVLIHRYLRAVYAVAFAHCNHHADAEDISQEAFLNAYKKLDSLRDASRFEGWVTTIARNLARKRGQRKHRTLEIRDDDAAVNVSDSSAISQSTSNEIHQLIRENIKNLDTHSREVLHLYYFAGKSTQEIADLLEASQSAILKRLQRGRERLGERLLTQYKDTFAPEQSDKDRSDTIVKSIVAVTPTWLIDSGTTMLASTTAATGLSTLVKLAVAAAIGSTFYIAASLFLMQQEDPTIASFSPRKSLNARRCLRG